MADARRTLRWWGIPSSNDNYDLRDVNSFNCPQNDFNAKVQAFESQLQQTFDKMMSCFDKISCMKAVEVVKEGGGVSIHSDTLLLKEEDNVKFPIVAENLEASKEDVQHLLVDDDMAMDEGNDQSIDTKLDKVIPVLAGLNEPIVIANVNADKITHLTNKYEIDGFPTLKVFLNKVPPQMELIAYEILVPLLDLFHRHVEKALAIAGKRERETEKLLLILCKCIYLAVRSHMPSALAPHLSSFCGDLFGIVNSLSFDGDVTLEDWHSLRLKTGKRSLLIFCALVTRHRKLSDKLMPNIVNCVSKIVKHITNLSNLDFPSERIVTFAFDVISRVLETGPGWRLVSPHFSPLLEYAIFPALMMNEKDTTEWEEDAEEYMRKNLPSELGENSGWKDDLFTARKSALNLLGVISMSKGPPVVGSDYNSSLLSKCKKGDKYKGKDLSWIGELLVVTFLSKFPIPSDVNAHATKILQEYYGVLMAYGSLQDFLTEQNVKYTATLVRMRVLPLYTIPMPLPYLIASANWVLGELASCLPEEMSADIYSSLLKALTMPDMEDEKPKELIKMLGAATSTNRDLVFGYVGVKQWEDFYGFGSFAYLALGPRWSLWSVQFWKEIIQLHSNVTSLLLESCSRHFRRSDLGGGIRVWLTLEDKGVSKGGVFVMNKWLALISGGVC